MSSTLLESFRDVYRRLDRTNCQSALLDSIYHRDVVFEDPFHRTESLEALKSYCGAMYRSALSVEFDFGEDVVAGDSQGEQPGGGGGRAVVTWVMRYRHPRLRSGCTIFVEGSTLLHFDNKIRFHKDYYDGGALLYEQLPLMGGAIRYLKKRLTAE